MDRGLTWEDSTPVNVVNLETHRTTLELNGYVLERTLDRGRGVAEMEISEAVSESLRY